MPRCLRRGSLLRTAGGFRNRKFRRLRHPSTPLPRTDVSFARVRTGVATRVLGALSGQASTLPRDFPKHPFPRSRACRPRCCGFGRSCGPGSRTGNAAVPPAHIELSAGRGDSRTRTDVVYAALRLVSWVGSRWHWSSARRSHSCADAGRTPAPPSQSGRSD